MMVFYLSRTGTTLRQIHLKTMKTLYGHFLFEHYMTMKLISWGVRGGGVSPPGETL